MLGQKKEKKKNNKLFPFQQKVHIWYSFTYPFSYPPMHEDVCSLKVNELYGSY